MTTATPPALLGFFRQEALEYLDQLEQSVREAGADGPEPASFLAQARALRGSASMTRLDGLAEVPQTLERIAGGLRGAELRWDSRLQFAVQGALTEYRMLVDRVTAWGEPEQRQSRTQSVALAAVAAGYLSQVAPPPSPSGPVVPIARFFPGDGQSGVVHRDPSPPVTLAERFRGDIAASADGVARETEALIAGARGAQQLALNDGVRRALLGLSDVAESYGAASIATLATAMARAPLTRPAELVAVQAFAQQLMNRECTDAELAARVREQQAAWRTSGGALPSSASGSGSVHATPAATRRTPSPTVAPGATPAAPVRSTAAPASVTTAASATPPVPIDALLFRGAAALAEARRVHERLRARLAADGRLDAEGRALLAELGDLLALAGA